MKRLGLCTLTMLALSCGSKGTPSAPSPVATTPAAPAPAAPQLVTIVGKVTDSAPTLSNLGNVAVEFISGPSNGKSATTDLAGNYSIDGVTTGDATVRARLAGYVDATSSATITGARRFDFALRPNPQTITRTLNDAVNGGSPVCPDFYSTSREPCKAFEIPAHNSGRLTAVLTWSRPSSTSGNDLELALLKAPRSNPEDRIVIARDIFVSRQEISADLTAGTMYYVHVLYGGGSAVQNFTLQLTHPN